jgi:hypothetical protein
MDHRYTRIHRIPRSNECMKLNYTNIITIHDQCSFWRTFFGLCADISRNHNTSAITFCENVNSALDTSCRCAANSQRCRDPTHNSLQCATMICKSKAASTRETIAKQYIFHCPVKNEQSEEGNYCSPVMSERFLAHGSASAASR